MPLTGIASAGINAVAGALSSALGSLSGKKQAEREQNFNAQQAHINRLYQTQERLATQEYNVAMWNLNNQYNERMLAEQRAYDSPTAQLERAMSAGINPNSVIGSLDGSSANFSAASPISSSPQSGSTASYSSGLPSALVGSQAQYLLAFAGAAANLAHAKESDAKAENIKNVTAWDRASFDDRLNAVRANTAKVLRETKNIDFTEEQTRNINEWVARHTSAQIDEINKKLILLDEQIALESEKVITERKQQNLIDSNIAVNESNKEYTDALKKVQDEIYEQEKTKTAFTKATEIPLGSSEWHVMYKLWKERKFSDVTKIGLYSSKDQYNRGLSTIFNKYDEYKQSFFDYLSSFYSFGRNMISAFNPSDMKAFYKSSNYYGRSQR